MSQTLKTVYLTCNQEQITVNEMWIASPVLEELNGAQDLKSMTAFTMRDTSGTVGMHVIRSINASTRATYLTQ